MFESDGQFSAERLNASCALDSFKRAVLPEGIPSHFDLSKVHDELSQSADIRTYDKHPSGVMFGSIAGEIFRWRAGGRLWSECSAIFPKFGDHNNLLVQKILLWNSERYTPSYYAPFPPREAFARLELDFLFTEGAVPGPHSFWAGSRWTDKGWVDRFTTPIVPTWLAGAYQNKLYLDGLHTIAPRRASSPTRRTIKQSTVSNNITKRPPGTPNLSIPAQSDSHYKTENAQLAKKRSKDEISVITWQEDREKIAQSKAQPETFSKKQRLPPINEVYTPLQPSISNNTYNGPNAVRWHNDSSTSQSRPDPVLLDLMSELQRRHANLASDNEKLLLETVQTWNAKLASDNKELQEAVKAHGTEFQSQQAIMIEILGRLRGMHQRGIAAMQPPGWEQAKTRGWQP